MSIITRAKGEIKFTEINDKKAIEKGLCQTLIFSIISINKIINVNTNQSIIIHLNKKYDNSYIK